ncbi:MAG: radical SAM protein [Bacteroidetes bacterium]|nr:radical SAM protein [Bacteroidota bacterium]
MGGLIAKALLRLSRKYLYRKSRYSHLMAFIRYNSSLKLINFLHNEMERRFHRIILSSKPYLVNSEPTNRCNYHCLFCPTGKGSVRNGGLADIQIYEKILKEIGQYLYLITIHGWGEPMMHKRLSEIIRLAHTRNVFTAITTNGYLMKRELSRELILSGLDYLVVSIDGASEETYSSYRVGGQFETVLNNIREMIALKKELKSSTPFVEWQFLVFRQNEHEMRAAEQLAKEIGADNIIFMPAYTEDEQFRSSDNKFHLPRFTPLSKPSDCRHLWSTLTFHWDGSVVPCCYDHTGRFSLGSLAHENFEHIWNNRHFSESRQIIKSGSPIHSQHLTCAQCVNLINV